MRTSLRAQQEDAKSWCFVGGLQEGFQETHVEGP